MTDVRMSVFRGSRGEPGEFDRTIVTICEVPIGRGCSSGASGA